MEYNNKDSIRKKALEQRNQLTKHEILQNSKEIFNRIFDTSTYKLAKTIFCYIPFKNEVDTTILINNALAMGKTVAAPLVTDRQLGNEKMIAKIIKNIDMDTRIGAFGIREPFTTLDTIDPSVIDLAIIPGVMYDENMNRLGFGRGFYDRYLCNLKSDCTKLGICYDFQVVDTIPSEKWDIKMDLIITEKRYIKGDLS